MDVAVNKAVDQIVKGRLTEYEQERPSLLKSLKRHEHVIARKLATLPVQIGASYASVMGAVGTIGFGVGSWIAPELGGHALASLGVAAAGYMTMVRGDIGVTPNQQDWADDMRKLHRLMNRAQEVGGDISDPRRLRELAHMNPIHRLVSPISKEVFKVADQMRKIEDTEYTGIRYPREYRAPTEMISDAAQAFQNSAAPQQRPRSGLSI